MTSDNSQLQFGDGITVPESLFQKHGGLVCSSGSRKTDYWVALLDQLNCRDDISVVFIDDKGITSEILAAM